MVVVEVTEAEVVEDLGQLVNSVIGMAMKRFIAGIGLTRIS